MGNVNKADQNTVLPLHFRVGTSTSSFTTNNLQKPFGEIYIDEAVFSRADLNDDNDFSDTDEEIYYLHNTQYSVHAIIDTSGSIIEVYKNYQPYGSVDVYTGDGGDSDWWDGDETTGSLSSNYYLFTGRRYDPEADLMFYRNRMHSTSRGRFLQRDPIGYVDGLNLYVFVKNNPLFWVDPMGNDDEFIIFRHFVNERLPIPRITNERSERPQYAIGDEDYYTQQETYVNRLNLVELWELLGLPTRPSSVDESCCKKLVRDCIADCIEEHRFDIARIITGDSSTPGVITQGAAHTSNAVANRLWGRVPANAIWTSMGRGAGSHPGSWQHAAASHLGGRSGAISRIGRAAGRLAVLATIIEGFYDGLVITSCIGLCNENPCYF